MSSYLVSRLMIDALVSAGRTWGLTDGPRHADLVGLTLWQENAAACPDIDRPAEYANEWLPGEPEPAQVLRWVHTFTYQAASSATWPGSAAQQWIRALEVEAARRAVTGWGPAVGAAAVAGTQVQAVMRSYAYSSARADLPGYARDTFTWK